eukprot:scaffold27571_cov60-Phaeocystis_antarctica.AAC.2
MRKQKRGPCALVNWSVGHGPPEPELAEALRLQRLDVRTAAQAERPATANGEFAYALKPGGRGAPSFHPRITLVPPCLGDCPAAGVHVALAINQQERLRGVPIDPAMACRRLQGRLVDAVVSSASSASRHAHAFAALRWRLQGFVRAHDRERWLFLVLVLVLVLVGISIYGIAPPHRPFSVGDEEKEAIVLVVHEDGVVRPGHLRSSVKAETGRLELLDLSRSPNLDSIARAGLCGAPEELL